MKTSRIAAWAVATALVGLTAAGAAAQSKEPVAVIKERQEHMKALSNAMKTVGAYVKKEGGTSADVQKAAATINERAKDELWTLFPTGTGTGVGESAAKPEIWQKQDEFKKAAQDLQKQTAVLVQAAQSGNDQQIAQAFQATGKTCGGCHDTFRVKKQQ